MVPGKGTNVRSWIAGLLLLALPVVGSAREEDADPRKGLETARGQCAACHAVERGNLRSVTPEAPAFAAIAAAPGISGMALAAAFGRSHRTMPALILTARERADLIAYILSLRGE
jgi:mono/diheme cytochrome c family protein